MKARQVKARQGPMQVQAIKVSARHGQLKTKASHGQMQIIKLSARQRWLKVSKARARQGKGRHDKAR